MKTIFSRPLFKQSLKANWKLWAVITGSLVIMLLILATVMGPIVVDSANQGGKPGGASNSLNSLLWKVFYGNIGLLMPMVYVMITANSLVANQVDRGSMAYTLSTPTKRTTVTLTKTIYLISAVFLMFFITAITNVIGLAIAGVEINLGEIVLLNLGLFLLQIALGGISFFFSCTFNLAKNSLACGVGVPVLFYIFSIIGSMGKPQAVASGMGSEILNIFNYMTIMSLYETDKIIAGNVVIVWQFLGLFLVSLVTYSAGTIVFKKKDLPL